MKIVVHYSGPDERFSARADKLRAIIEEQVLKNRLNITNLDGSDFFIEKCHEAAYEKGKNFVFVKLDITPFSWQITMDMLYAALDELLKIYSGILKNLGRGETIPLKVRITLSERIIEKKISIAL